MLVEVANCDSAERSISSSAEAEVPSSPEKLLLVLARC